MTRPNISLPPIVGTLAAVEGADTARKKRKRKPRLDRTIAQAEKAGKVVTSIVTSDGTTLNFTTESVEAANPWLAALGKRGKQ